MYTVGLEDDIQINNRNENDILIRLRHNEFLSVGAFALLPGNSTEGSNIGDSDPRTDILDSKYKQKLKYSITAVAEPVEATIFVSFFQWSLSLSKRPANMLAERSGKGQCAGGFDASTSSATTGSTTGGREQNPAEASLCGRDVNCNSPVARSE